MKQEEDDDGDGDVDGWMDGLEIIVAGCCVSINNRVTRD